MHDPDNIALRGISIINLVRRYREVFDECRKTETKLLTYQLNYSANLEP